MSSASLSTPLRSLPSVCAILLTADRPEFTKGAIDCFRSQSYANKHLLIWDSGKDPSSLTGAGCSSEIFTVYDDPAGRTIGELRNRANDFRSPYWSADIFVHFDSDDHSHADRISEQVRLLQATGAGCVGYNQMLFWKGSRREEAIAQQTTRAGGRAKHSPNSAWIGHRLLDGWIS